MEPKKDMTIHSRSKSFVFAFNGMAQLLREPNAKLHTVATVSVIIAGFVRHIGHGQWLAVIFAIGLVWITEALNTCIEKLCDFCCGNTYHPAIKVIKDVGAAAVLIAAIISVAIAIVVFIV